MSIISDIIYLISLTIQREVLWSVLPLVVATILIVSYFQRYREESPGWNGYLTTSLVLLFVSVDLFRYIYNIDGEGAVNFITYQAKSIASVFLFLIGFLILRFNFEHLLPERFAQYVSSPIAINVIAYGIILFVHSKETFSWGLLLGVILIMIILSLIFNSLKLPARKIFNYVEKEKKKDKVKDVKEEKFQIDELKRKLKDRQRILNKVELKRIDDQKKEALKLKKIIKNR